MVAFAALGALVLALIPYEYIATEYTWAEDPDLDCLDQLPGLQKYNDLRARREEIGKVEGVKSPNEQ